MNLKKNNNNQIGRKGQYAIMAAALICAGCVCTCLSVQCFTLCCSLSHSLSQSIRRVWTFAKSTCSLCCLFGRVLIIRSMGVGVVKEQHLRANGQGKKQKDNTQGVSLKDRLKDEKRSLQSMMDNTTQKRNKQEKTKE